MKALMRTRPFVPLLMLFVISVGISSTPMLNGCASNPTTIAKTLDQKAYATYGQFVIFEEKAAALSKDPAVPASVKEALSKADAAAYPLATSLNDAVLEVDAIRDQLAAGTTTKEKLDLAVLNLNSIYLTAKPSILALVDAVKGVKK